MTLFAAVVLIHCVGLLVFEYWKEAFKDKSATGPGSFWRWLAAGLIVPSLSWLVLNCALVPGFPPLIPEIAWAKSSGRSWMALVPSRTAPGLLVIASYWAAVTFGHLSVLIAIRAESRREFAVTTGAMSLLLVPLASWAWWIGGLPWAGVACLLWLVPVFHCTKWLVWKPSAAPMYGQAIALAKRGKYRSAESEVIRQLEHRENDFEGWMMLADLYASHFRDLAEADRTVRAVCSEPSVTALQASIAFHRLADWHLNIGDDPVAARSALKELCRRWPGTHVAKMAELRMHQLPQSRQEWMDRKKPATIRLPALTGDLSETQDHGGPRLSRADAAKLSNEYVELLKRDPNDVAPREKLAALLAEELGRVDLGIEQLALLAEMPGQPEQKRAEWLSRMAAWHFRYRRDRAAAKDILQRLVRENPHSAQGFAAQRWLNLLEMEGQAQDGFSSNEAKGTAKIHVAH